MLALMLTLAAASTPVYLDAPDELRAWVRAELRRERPQLEWVETASAARWVFTLMVHDDELELEVSAAGHVVETRSLGPATEAGSRRAVLLIVHHLEAEPPKAEPPSSMAPPSVRAIAAPSPWLYAALGPSLSWSNTAGVGVGAAIAADLEGWRVGLRAMVGGLCCTASGDHLQADTLQIVGLVEVGRVVWSGPVDVGWALGVGAGYEIVNAQVVDLFAGPAGPEQTSASTLVARAGGTVAWAWSARWALELSGGVELFGGAREISLPAPYREGRAPLTREAALPFVDVGLRATLF